ncbi:Gfo/Idh/MocA family protein [Paenibacillus sp. FJAT-27812]|uniref:Gfo/Idh/MocA family protein n=1 Tax=Paenibacillus sp. FJAT-27812 TaxID=1684143 RepID=UPI0006A77E1D|nr:Gfo/Idh/MocA family oxidoreductase [Paenibacillus sp. FJAT-27812]
MSKLRIGMVGLGGIAQKVYLPLLSRASDWTFAGAYSPSAEKRMAICGEYRIESFGSLSELAESCDAVFVHSSTDSHFEVVSTLLNRGKDVYVDKPLAATLEESEQLAELSVKLGRKLMVGFNRRFAPLYVQAKQHTVQAAWIRMEKHRTNSVGPHMVNFTMLDDYLHLVDTARWLADGKADLQNGIVRINDENQLLYAQHQYNASAGYSVSTAMHRNAGTSIEQLEIVAAGEMIRVKNMSLLEVERDDKLTTIFPPAWQTILKQRGFEDAVHHFVQCIIHDQKLAVDGEEALKSQQLLMSMLN